MHEGLGFGVAQADVEFEHFGAVGGHHQAGVEEAGKAGRLDGGANDEVEDCCGLGLGEDARVAIGAHAAGVGAVVAVEDGFVILCGLERDHVASVAEGDEADFLAVRNSSTTNGGFRDARAASASARSSAMTTPLPAARPSDLMTSG